MSPTVGIVVPAYRPDIDQLRAYVTALREALSPETIRVEIDTPTQGVLDRLDGIPAAVHHVPYRRGKGAAITAGFEFLETDVLVFADADGSTPAAELAKIVAAVETGPADLAVGSRRHPDAEIASHQTFARRFLGDAFAWLAGKLLSVSLDDYQCGAKAIDAESWAQVRSHLYESGFAWDVELIAIAGALGRRVEEVPIRWEDQPGSTVSPVSDSLALLRALLATRHRAKLLSDNPLHSAIAAHREDPTALVERDQ